MTLTSAAAIQYVRDVFARAGETVTIFDTTSDDGAIHVDYELQGRNETMTVWVETRADGSPYLYGEW